MNQNTNKNFKSNNPTNPVRRKKLAKRLIRHLDRHHMTQKAFMRDLIEDALEQDEALTQAEDDPAEDEEQLSGMAITVEEIKPVIKKEPFVLTGNRCHIIIGNGRYKRYE